jgi:hypothetical protein
MQERTGINNNTVGYNVIEMSGASFFVPKLFPIPNPSTISTCRHMVDV